MKNEDKMAWLIMEYQELRKEIERRSKEQFICVSGSLVALGSTLGFIAKNPCVYSPLLIIVPWVLAVFGIIWVDHGQYIFLIGSYIRQEIENRIGVLIEENNIGWQNHVSLFRRGEQFPSLITYVLPALYFMLPSVMCIFSYLFIRFYKATRLPIFAEITLIVVGTILLVVLSIFWVRAVKAVKEKEKRQV